MEARMKRTEETEKILTERFGRDTLIALATESNGTPYVRTVNACYEDGAFYIITHALSNRTPPPPSRGSGSPPTAGASIWGTSEKKRTAGSRTG